MNKLLFVNGYHIGWATSKEEIVGKYPKALSIDEGAFIIQVSTIQQ